jgi:hypothetical protein
MPDDCGPISPKFVTSLSNSMIQKNVLGTNRPFIEATYFIQD